MVLRLLPFLLPLPRGSVSASARAAPWSLQSCDLPLPLAAIILGNSPCVFHPTSPSSLPDLSCANGQNLLKEHRCGYSHPVLSHHSRGITRDLPSILATSLTPQSALEASLWNHISTHFLPAAWYLQFVLYSSFSCLYCQLNCMQFEDRDQFLCTVLYA